jgi:septin family protein
MKKLQKYCAIVPILAKGDLFSLDEVREIKQSLLEKQKIYKLEWFDFHAV